MEVEADRLERGLAGRGVLFLLDPCKEAPFPGRAYSNIRNLLVLMEIFF